MQSDPTLRALREEFKRRPLLAMPVAGALAWAGVAAFGLVLPARQAALALFVCVGAIFWLAVLIGPLVGDPVIRRGRPSGEMDRLFFQCVLMANLVWAIAIPFYLTSPSSLPLSVGVLTGLMWIPLSWIIEHWIGLFHAIARTILVVATWYLFPELRFVAIPIVIVALYLISIAILVRRHRAALSAAPVLA